MAKQELCKYRILLRKTQQKMINKTHTGQWKPGEEIIEFLVDFKVVPVPTLGQKAVHRIYPNALMVSAEHEHISGIQYLVDEQKAQHFDGVATTVDIIPQKKVVCSGRMFSYKTRFSLGSHVRYGDTTSMYAIGYHSNSACAACCYTSSAGNMSFSNMFLSHGLQYSYGA